MCLAHCSEAERAAELKLISETGVIDARGVPITPALLEGAIVAAPRGDNGLSLIKACRFDRATFEGAVWFPEATFSGDAEFSGASFKDTARFDGAIFKGPARFDNVTFSNEAGFSSTTFSGDASFYKATFEGAAWFTEATFTCDAVFQGATFKGTALFDKAIFHVMASFSGTTFDGAASFRAIFKGDALFGEANFSSAADFDQVTFSGYSWFSRVKFKNAAWFYSTTFSRNASFDRATFKDSTTFYKAIFSGDAVFGRAIFSGEADFYGTIFAGRADFSHAKFEQARQFGPMLVCLGLMLDETQFIQQARIEVSSMGVSCRGARFPGGVQFGLRWALVALDESDLAASSIVAGVSRPFTEELARSEEQIVKKWQQVLGGEISERPQVLSLRGADVAGLGLSNISAADCWFAGAHNLDKLRLESDVNFTYAPIPLRLAGSTWGGRQVIAEERAWRASQVCRTVPASDTSARKPRWDPPWWPTVWPIEAYVLDLLAPGQIAASYRALRKGREDIKDEPSAADFYYGEMEMRRHARPVGTGNPGGQPTAASRGLVERGILTTYWLVSGYGLRAYRAVAWLAAITALLALGFWLLGFAVPPHPDTYWTSLLYSFRATLSLTDSDIKLTAWGQLLQGVLRLTGPVLLGLALLALRGRVKR